jgi:rare lipoprotein A
MASWYGSAFHGRRTANGEVYDMASLSAAHPTMPLPSYARVTNLTNGYSVIVRVNDRGPFHGGRVMDVSSRVADVLEFKGAGTAKIRVDYMGRAPMEGSDDGRLLASLRTDGRLATLDGIPLDDGTMVAERTPNPPRPEPEPEPQPVRVALAVPPLVRPPEPQPVPAPAPSYYAAPAHAPLPPSRPFDLGTIPDAAIPVAAPIPALPPRRPIIQASAERALYFAPPPRLDPAALGRDPFARLKAAEAILPPPRP